MYFKENAKNAEENTAEMTFIYQLLYLLRENEKKSIWLVLLMYWESVKQQTERQINHLMPRCIHGI